MTDNGATLTVDAQGFLHWGDLRLFVRYEDGKVWFPVKHPGDRERLKCKRVGIPLDEFAGLEAGETQAIRRGPALGEFRAVERTRRRSVTRRNKIVDKP